MVLILSNRKNKTDRSDHVIRLSIFTAVSCSRLIKSFFQPESEVSLTIFSHGLNNCTTDIFTLDTVGLLLIPAVVVV